MSNNIKPFLKWAGGKTQLLEQIINELPENIIEKNRYVEPFVGAGSVFLYFLENDYFDEYIINDINEKLINVYYVVKDKPYELISGIKAMKDEYLYGNMEQREQQFYKIREDFNNTYTDEIKQACDFIFLNKTCFNGLYRENSKGFFNVPFGKHKNPSIFDEGLILSISELLNKKNPNGDYKVKIFNKSYDEIESYIDSSTFVYCDPPYRPVTVGGFTSYNKSNFNDESQIKLADFYKRVDKRGADIMLSNSDPKNLDNDDEFFDNLYADYNIKRVFAKRSINSSGSGRGKISEILVTNY